MLEQLSKNMENLRIEFTSKKLRKKFFEELRKVTNSKNFKELSKKLGVNYGSLKLWIAGARTLPVTLVKEWQRKYTINLEEFKAKVLDLKNMLKQASKRGVQKLQKKYGKKWMKILGKRGKKKLDQLLKKNFQLRKKWKISIKQALLKKYGSDAYKILGQKGGKVFLQKVDLNTLKKQLKKAFRKSLSKYQTEAKGFKLRSRKEVEVLNFLLSKGITFEYEKEVLGFYPDFYLPNNRTIIEVVGFEWKPRIDKILTKFNTLLHYGHRLIVYTYPNMVKYFENLPVIVVTDIEGLNKALA
jgi:very-short-patch-repair endonuclease